jgi:beta-hydroxyacyl-ACP dehydratase FabZ
MDVLKILPHRYPFLLVDRILETDGETFMIGIKNVSRGEPFFQGHFPGHPVMPGALIVEAMAQVGAALLFYKNADRGTRMVYFSGIDRCRFRRPVVPGDQLRIEVKLVRQRSCRYFKMKGRALVDGIVAAEGELSCSVVSRVNAAVAGDEWSEENSP